MPTIDTIADEIFNEYDEVFKSLQVSEKLEAMQVQILNGEQLINDSITRYFGSIKNIHHNGVSFKVSAMDKILYEQVADGEYMLRLLLNGKIVLTEIISKSRQYRVEWNKNTKDYHFEVVEIKDCKDK